MAKSLGMSMDVSTQLNNWIALTAELEETREAIAKEVFKHYKANRVMDDFACDVCRKIDGLLQEAKDQQQYLEDDFRPFLEAGGDTGLARTKAKAMNFITQYYINWTVAGYKRSFREAYIELGMRAITMCENGAEIVNDPKVIGLCRYALRLQKDTQERWEEITVLQKERKGNIFFNLVQDFAVNFTAFARTQSIPILNRFLKRDDALQKKIREQYRKAMLTVQSGSR